MKRDPLVRDFLEITGIGAAGTGIGTVLAVLYGWQPLFGALCGAFCACMLCGPCEVARTLRHAVRRIPYSVTSKFASVRIACGQSMCEMVKWMYVFFIIMLWCLMAFVAFAAITFGRTLLGPQDEILIIGMLTALCGFIGMWSSIYSLHMFESACNGEGEGNNFPLLKCAGAVMDGFGKMITYDPVSPFVQWRNKGGRLIAKRSLLVLGSLSGVLGIVLPLVSMAFFALTCVVWILDILLTVSFALAKTKRLACMINAFFGTLAGYASNALGWGGSVSHAVLIGIVFGFAVGHAAYFGRVWCERNLYGFLKRFAPAA